jgi:hypothetical protein
MPATQEVERPQAALAVARQYLRRERTLSALVGVLPASVFVGVFLATSLVLALVAGAVLVVVVRVPLVRSHGTVRLRTDDDVATVVDSFTGPTPPVLTFQWGIADKITATESKVTYHVSYLLGLRSVDVTVYTRTDTTSSGERRVELEVTVDEQPWATYTATISRQNGQTVVDCEYASDRRFGLRRVPQRIVAERYRDRSLAVQGYTAVERNEQYGV